MTTGATPQRRRRGRPRRDQRETDREPQEEILHQAGLLFAQQGYAATSTRQIATAARLQQASVFYYFPTKQDILVTLSERSMERPLALLAAATAAPCSPAARLHLVLEGLIRRKLVQPFDLVPLLMQHPDAPDSPRFERFYADAARFAKGVRSLIIEGEQEGQLRPGDPTIASNALLGIANWVPYWHRKASRRPVEAVTAELVQRALAAVAAPGLDLDGVTTEAATCAGHLEDWP